MLTVRENVEYEKAESWMCIYYKFKLPELFYWFHIPKMTATIKTEILLKIGVKHHRVSTHPSLNISYYFVIWMFCLKLTTNFNLHNRPLKSWKYFTDSIFSERQILFIIGCGGISIYEKYISEKRQEIWNKNLMLLAYTTLGLHTLPWTHICLAYSWYISLS
jgi:hypothetical protein